jgi:hypothetical protein
VSSNSKAMLMISEAFPFALPQKFTSHEAEFRHMSLSESEKLSPNVLSGNPCAVPRKLLLELDAIYSWEFGVRGSPLCSEASMILITVPIISSVYSQELSMTAACPRYLNGPMAGRCARGQTNSSRSFIYVSVAPKYLYFGGSNSATLAIWFIGFLPLAESVPEYIIQSIIKSSLYLFISHLFLTAIEQWFIQNIIVSKTSIPVSISISLTITMLQSRGHWHNIRLCCHGRVSLDECFSRSELIAGLHGPFAVNKSPIRWITISKDDLSISAF